MYIHLFKSRNSKASHSTLEDEKTDENSKIQFRQMKSIDGVMINSKKVSYNDNHEDLDSDDHDHVRFSQSEE